MPHPDGRETRQERHHQKQRGPLGFHVLTGPSPAVEHKVPRELARALWKRGYDVSVEFEDTGQTGWNRTSIRHLEGMVKQPFVLLSYGPALKDYLGQVRVQIESADTGHHMDDRHLQYINERVDLLIVPSQRSLDAYQQAGVTIPIEIVRWGVDTNVYQPWPKDEELLSKVVWPGAPRRGEKLLLAMGRTAEQYGLAECLIAFRSAVEGGLEASLIVAQDPFSYHEDVTAMVAALAHDLPVGIISGLDEWSMARLYSSVDCYISHNKGYSEELQSIEACCCHTSALHYPDAEVLCCFDGPSPGWEDGLECFRHRCSWSRSADALVAAVREHVTQPPLWSSYDDDIWKMANGVEPGDFGPRAGRGRIAVRITAPSDEAGQHAMRTYSEAALDFWWGDFMAHVRAVEGK